MLKKKSVLAACFAEIKLEKVKQSKNIFTEQKPDIDS